MLSASKIVGSDLQDPAERWSGQVQPDRNSSLMKRERQKPTLGGRGREDKQNILSTEL